MSGICLQEEDFVEDEVTAGLISLLNTEKNKVGHFRMTANGLQVAKLHVASRAHCGSPQHCSS